MPSEAGVESSEDQTGKRRVVLLDERPLVLECTCRSLRAGFRDFEVVPFNSIDAAASALRNAARPALIVLATGVSQVSDMHVKDCIHRLASVFPGTPVVIFSDRNDGTEAAEALHLGARGYVPTAVPLEVMIAAMRLVMAGGTFIPESALGRNAFDDATLNGTRRHRILSNLTPRERQIVVRLREGKPNKIIARELSLSVGTVQVHVRRILQKLHATSRSQVAYILSHAIDDADAKGDGLGSAE